MEKFTDVYSIKIQHPLKHHIEDLPPELKKRMNKELRLLMEKFVHEAQFKPGMYSGEEEQGYGS